MAIKECLCKHNLKPGMLVYRHFCGGTIIGEVERVNERSARVRKLNDACTALSDERVALKFKPSKAPLHHLGNSPCFCVTDLHELTPAVAQEKYFRDMLVGCNSYIAAKLGWDERPPSTDGMFLGRARAEEIMSAAPEYVPSKQAENSVNVTDCINAGKYPALSSRQFNINILRRDLERQFIGARSKDWIAAHSEQLDTLFNLAWKHGDPRRYDLHEVVFWYGELAPLVKLS